RSTFAAASLGLLTVAATMAGAGSAEAVPQHLRGAIVPLPVHRPRPHVMAARGTVLRSRSPLNSPIGGYLAYQGGPVDQSATVYIDFWGFRSDPSGERAYLQKFLSNVQPTLWVNITTQYCQGISSGAPFCPTPSVRATAATGPLRSVWNDPSTPPLNPGSPSGNDSALQAEVAAADAHFGNPGGDPIFLIATPTGDQTSSSGFGLSTGWCAYHDITGSGLQYIDLPYTTDAGAVCGKNSVHGGSAGRDDGVSIVSGHELAETITDPDPQTGWVDGNGNEIADKCAWYDLADAQTNVGPFAIQPLWSNLRASSPVADDGCVHDWLSSYKDAGSVGIHDISVGANGVAWAVTIFGGVHGLERASCISQCAWNPAPAPRSAVDVAVGPHGDPWVITASHQIYYWHGSGITRMPNAPSARVISVGADGSVWIVSDTKVNQAGYALYKYDGNFKWTREPGAAVDIAVGPHGNPWILSASHRIFRWNGKKYVRLPGTAEDIAVGSVGQPWILGLPKLPPYGYPVYVLIDNVWVQVHSANAYGSDLAVYQDDVVVVDYGAGVYYSDPF
ncbi:MAG: hypothetical protein ACLQFR_23750, partial [Streptosporangiaceae bacterium]